MITAILDTNVVVQSLIGPSAGASAKAVDACHDERYRLIYSPAVLDEWLEVLSVPHIRRRHGLSDDELLEFLASLLANATSHAGNFLLPASIARDITDTKFLSLAHESRAAYLVTNDRRHLLRLERYEHTRIITPNRFVQFLQ